SVDSLKLLEELIKRESEYPGRELKIFFQVKTSHEEEKSGFESIEVLFLAIDQILGLTQSKLQFFGLMTMGAIRTSDFESEATRCFKELAIIARNVEKKYSLKDPLKLSMGMSQDYKLALLEGSDFIRIGSAIFKE
nr:hypothetical protein [Bacteriovorax sp.]